MPGAANILTVDLEEWFHIDEAVIPAGKWDRLPSRVEENTRRLLALLEACGARATFFIVGWSAARHQALIHEIHERGHEVATHGYLHASVAAMSAGEFAADLRAAREAVEGCTGEAVVGYRAPRWTLGGVPGAGKRGRASGIVTPAMDVLIREGFLYDSSLAPIVHIGDPDWPRDPYRIDRPGGSILELPPLVGRRFGVRLLFAGGFGLRRVPNRVILREIEARNRSGFPAVIDVHTWELDPDPPRIRLPFKYRLGHYSGLAGFPPKLEDLLRSTTWSPARDYALDRSGNIERGRPSGGISGRPRRLGLAP